jgi:hypothetical protein
MSHWYHCTMYIGITLTFSLICETFQLCLPVQWKSCSGRYILLKVVSVYVQWLYLDLYKILFLLLRQSLYWCGLLVGLQCSLLHWHCEVHVYISEFNVCFAFLIILSMMLSCIRPNFYNKLKSPLLKKKSRPIKTNMIWAINSEMQLYPDCSDNYLISNVHLW